MKITGVDHRVHWLVEGVGYNSVPDILRIAKSKGFNGTLSCLTGRLQRGMATWAELSAPTRNPGNPGRHQPGDDLLAAIAAVDARKREIAAAQAKDEEE